MKKILLFIIPLLAMMSSCIKDEMAECPSCKDKVRFSLQVREEGVQYVTRATDERTVRDVNLFLYDPRGVLPTDSSTSRAARWSAPCCPAATKPTPS